MGIAKRIFLFLITNILIVVTLSIVMSVLGVQPWLQANGINYNSLIIFCLIWGFGGAFISLLLSKVMAKWMMGVKIIDENVRDADLQWVRETTLRLAKSAGLPKNPDVGYYESPEMNAFATGPSKSNSLVAVSTGLLQRMSKKEAEGVLAHEVAHIANGDMVTMTLVQGVVNAFVMFISRVLVHTLSQFLDEKQRPIVQFVGVIVFEIILGFLGMMVVASFSRAREFRADKGGATLGGRENMIAALRALQRQYEMPTSNDSLAAMKISGGKKGWMQFFSTHPPLEDRIAALEGRM
jgi:heat shock protein HtpX